MGRGIHSLPNPNKNNELFMLRPLSNQAPSSLELCKMEPHLMELQ